MGVFTVDPDVYHRYKDEVLRLSNSFQRNIKIDLPNRMRGLSDKEIAERLGLDERTVSEIRCVAERDCYGLDEWEQAIAFKEKACREYLEGTRKKVKDSEQQSAVRQT
jgi:hypothetical protein